MVGRRTDEADGRFADAPISRRGFVRLSAATAGALTLPSNALSDHTSPKTGNLYAFLRNHTRDSFEIPTLIRLGDVSGLDAFDDLAEQITRFRETTEPEPAAYGQLDETNIEEVLDIDIVVTLEYSPGANPFWKLGGYSEGVFPDPEEAVDFVGFEETVAGLEHLEAEHEDRFRLASIGESPGEHNVFTGETDSQDIWVAELTNDVDDKETFTGKDKLVYTLSIHGDERVGVEAGTRFIERVLAGEEPDVEAVLDDAVLVFLYPNPDGWRSREPRYPGQLNDFDRVTGTGVDPNRQYPTAGWIDPGYYPADSNGRTLIDDSPGIDEDIPERVADHTTDTLAIVEHMRGYENVDFFADLHGMHWSEEFVLSLVPNAQFDHADLTEIERVNRAIGTEMESQIGSAEENSEAFLRGAERYDPVREEEMDLPSNEEMVPDSLYDYGTIYDTIDYSTTGGFLSWVAHPEEAGGLGARSIAIEMAFNNTISPMEKEYVPELMDVQVGAFIAALRAMTTTVVETVDATIAGDRSTAVVTADALTESSDELSFAGTESVTTRATAEIDGGGEEAVTFTVSEPTDEVAVHVRPQRTDPIRAMLSGPDGAERRTFNGVGGSGEGREAEWTITDPAAGQWTVTVENPRRAGSTEAAVLVDAVVSDADDAPDPRDVLGYEQRLYESTPFTYFEAYDGVSEGSVEFVSSEAVGSGVLTDGDEPVYDNVVAIHDSIDALDAFDDYIEAGGNLVLTDTGIRLLCDLTAEPAATIGPRAVSTGEYEFAALDERKVDGHPLLENTREIERELWTLAPRGYAIAEEAPVTTVVPEVFEAAGGTVAATVDGGVAVGSLGENVHVIGSLLPPSSQRHLHPFGLLDYSVSMLGHTILSNALGYDTTA